MLTVGSLFSGIGGLELGLERTGGFRTVWQCEADPWARQVLARHWPGVPCYPDVRGLGGDLPRADAVVGGFPCQDISDAGARAGLDGERSGLWSEFARVVRLVRPRYVVVENVAALLHRGVDRVLGDMARLGYDAEWGVLRACDVGSPQFRARLFILAYAPRLGGGEAAEVPRPPREPLPRGEGEAVGGHPWPPGPEEHDAWREYLGRHPGVEPAVRRGVHGIPRRVDRLRGLGNAVVPHVAEVLGRRILEIEAQGGMTA
ncbi:MAG TPA: DNA cytosine methyltransferase [Candidatus Thermoplasmatota archaeon]|nr:DNA cytosine methyltransferase [Candidatus Thermoplasmatota archaeon]